MAVQRCRGVTSLSVNYLYNTLFCSATHNLVRPYPSLAREVFPDGLGALMSMGDVGVPARLPRHPSVLLLPSISASTRSTVGSEKTDESKCPTRPAAGAADGSGEYGRCALVSRSARRALSPSKESLSQESVVERWERGQLIVENISVHEEG
jgi:hypothetical protein